MDLSKLFAKYFLKQKMMRTVILTLVPIFVFSIFQFGWRVLGLLLVNIIFASLSEFWIMRMINKDKAKISEAALVSAALYTLTLPPVLPFWMSAVGIIFGIIIGKCVFGGFGQNIFNPALVARCFIYVCFPVQMTVQWLNPIGGILGGLGRWSAGPDAISSVTPMINMEMNGIATPLWKMFLGNTAGSIGETSALLIILAAAYLIYTKTANWKVMASVFGSGLVMAIILFATGQSVYSPIFQILSGGFLFGTVFMATDPVTHPQKDIARIAFGILVGTVTMILRTYSLFTEGMMFAILIGNSFSPLLDRNVKEFEKKRKEKLEAKKVTTVNENSSVKEA